MSDQTVEAGLVLRLPEDLLRVQEIVAEEFRLHEGHAHSRAREAAAEMLRDRARHLRATHGPDPLTDALTRRCHTQAGLIHAAPSVVAAVALEEIAACLDPREETSHA